jgi:triacylglycerol lipase
LYAKPVETPPLTPERPVILVHGFVDTSIKLRPMANYLRKRGWTVYTPTLKPGNAAAGLEPLAAQLKAYTNEHCGPAQPVDLVGFSMGGLICRYYVQRLGGAPRVRHLVTISSPHHGTWMAYASGSLGARQMRPNSAFLNDLNSDTAPLKQLRFTWTPLDLMILPPRSSRMDFGKEELIWMPAHPLMVWSPACMRAVAAALRE